MTYAYLIDIPLSFIILIICPGTILYSQTRCILIMHRYIHEDQLKHISVSKVLSGLHQPTLFRRIRDPHGLVLWVQESNHISGSEFQERLC